MPELICPVCAQPLQEQERVYRCAGGHSFDRAKSGYVNLLIQRQSGAQHGDDKEMVRARRAFLDGGFYAPLQEKVCAAAVRWAPAREEVDVLDSGCGECYYTAAVEQALRTRGKTPSIVGVDISKDALRWGENAAPRCSWRWPVPSGCRWQQIPVICCWMCLPRLRGRNIAGCCAGAAWCSMYRRERTTFGN